MATIFFDGKSNVTATSKDTVIITAVPSLFTQASDNLVGGSTFSFGSATLTFTDVSVADADKVTTLAGGNFNTSSDSGATQASTSRNDLIINAQDGQAVTFGNTDSTGVHALFGGFGVSSGADQAETFTFNSKDANNAAANNSGSYLIYGNGGDDTINQTGSTTFDSTSFVTIFGGKGNDSITLSAANGVNGASSKANFSVVGGEGNDKINVTNTGTAGSTTILGGQGPGDALDSADTITFNGGGTFTIYGNGGDDSIGLGTVGLDTTTRGTVFGGEGSDSIVAGNFATNGGTLTTFGGNGIDTITVTGNAGRTVIYGGSSAGDTGDSGDSITFQNASTGTASSSATIYGNGGNDTIVLTATGGNTGSATSVFGGVGSDIIAVTAAEATTGRFLLTGNDGQDTYGIGTDAAALTSVVNGGTIEITDFVSGQDRISLNSQGGAGAGTTVQNLGVQTGTLNDALAAATATGVSRVAVFQLGADSYLVRNDGNAGFNATTDAVIKLDNVTANAALVNSITVSG